MRRSCAVNHRDKLHRLLGINARSVADATAALAIDPKNGAALASRAGANQRLGKADLAMTDADEALRLDPKSVTALLARAFAKATTDKAAAIIDLKKVLESDPQLAVAQAALRRLGG